MKQVLWIAAVSAAVTLTLFVATPWALGAFVAWTNLLPSGVAPFLPIALPSTVALLVAVVWALRYWWNGATPTDATGVSSEPPSRR